MKRFCIITLAILCLGVNRNIHAEIINGYEEEVRKTVKYIRNLNGIAQDVLNAAQREKLNQLLQAAQATAEKLRENHAKTQELIEMLRIIDPDLYDEINTIQDREGNATDVYVKVVDALKGGLRGGTNLNQTVENPHVYTSEYGNYTVSVRVTYSSIEEALRILVHELGHVRYQVPHLSAYCQFYKRFYASHFKRDDIGHLPHDPSNVSVKTTLKAFKASLREYKKERRWMVKNQSRKMLVSTRED